MADNMCGPSNGAKNLVNHINRDRSLQQDRMVNGVSHSPSFRTQPTHGSSAEQAFTGFQQHVTMEPVSGGPVHPVAAFAPGIHAPAPSHAFVAQHPQTPVNINMPLLAPAAHASAAAPRDWVNQFSSMQIGPSSAHPAATNVAFHRPDLAIHDSHLNPSAMNMGLAPATFAPVGFSQPHAPYHHGISHMGVTNAMYGTQNQAAPMQQGESSLDVEAFNRAFGDYDEAEFKEELASWAEKEAADKEFEAAQAEWMEQHGPIAEARAEAKVAEEKVDERRHREDEELARAAISILNSVSENNSEKFKKSNFLELMRRIGNREVVVDGPHLVDASTGETLVSRDENGSVSPEDGPGGGPGAGPAAEEDTALRIPGP